MALIPRKRVLVIAFGATVTVAVIKRVRAHRRRAAAASAQSPAWTPAPTPPSSEPASEPAPMHEASAAVELAVEPGFVAIDLAPAENDFQLTGDEPVVALADEPIIVVTSSELDEPSDLIAAGLPELDAYADEAREPAAIDADRVDGTEHAYPALAELITEPPAEAADFAWTAPELESIEVDEPVWTAYEAATAATDEPEWTAPENQADDDVEALLSASDATAVEDEELIEPVTMGFEPVWTAPQATSTDGDDALPVATEPAAVVEQPSWTAVEPVAVEDDALLWTAADTEALADDEPLLAASETEALADKEPLWAASETEALADDEPLWAAPAAEGIELAEALPVASMQLERRDNWAIWAALASMAVEVDTPLWTTLETAGLELDEPLWAALRAADARANGASAAELAVWTPSAFEDLAWDAPQPLRSDEPAEPAQTGERTWLSVDDVEPVSEQAENRAPDSFEPIVDAELETPSAEVEPEWVADAEPMEVVLAEESVEELVSEGDAEELVADFVAQDDAEALAAGVVAETEELVADIAAEAPAEDPGEAEPVAAESDVTVGSEPTSAEEDPNYAGPWRRVTDFDPVAEEDSVYEGPRRRASDFDVDRGQRELAAAIAQQHADEDARRAAAPPRKPIGQIGLNRPAVVVKVLTGPLADE